jgi:hypothetical protein
MSGAIPGWRVEPVGVRDRGRRQVVEVIGDAIRFYRTRARAVVLLSAVVEGTVTVVNLPYYAAQIDAASRIFALDAPTMTDQPGAVLLGAIAGLTSALSFGGLIVLILLLSVLLFAPDGPDAVRDAMGNVRRRWRTVLPPFVLIAMGCCALGGVAAAAAWPLESAPLALDAGRRILLSFAFLAGGFLAIGAFFYLAARWAVAAPALIVDGFSLRTSLARSAALTRRRMGYVALVVVSTSFLSGLVACVFTLAALAVLWFVGREGLPAWAIAGLIYVTGRVLVAPVVPLAIAILYHDLRAAGPAPG